MSNAIQIKDIANRIGMQPGSINAAGHKISDSISFEDAIQFVQERAYAKGRWTVDKANKAQAYLNELLESRQTGTSLVAIEPTKEVAKVVKAVTKPAEQKDASTHAQKMVTVESVSMLILPALVTLLSVTLTVTGLYMFALWAGAMLGGMFGLVLISAVVVARNKNKGDTSYQALNTVFYMEAGACALHFFTFHSLLPKADGDFSMVFNLVCPFVCSVFASFLSYRSVIMVRNYNAEV